MTLLLGLLLAASPAHAHLELGTYHGTAPAPGNEACSFKVVEIAAAYDTPHPLNERVTLELADGLRVELRHPVSIDSGAATIGFDHEHLSGARGVRTGNASATELAVVLTMNHGAGHHGPTELVLIHQDSSDPNNTGKATCLNLKHE